MKINKSILQKGFVIDNCYEVIHFIKKGNNAENYRVKGYDGKLYFMKLFDYSKIHYSSFDEKGNLLEIKFLKNLNHENIVSYANSGEIVLDNKKYIYLVLDFIAGETLEEKISRESFHTYFDIKEIIIDILEGLKYLHNLPEPIIHNEITPQNIMLDLTTDEHKAIIIDFGHARSIYQSTKSYNKEGLNLIYVASECFNNLYSPQSDIFSVGVVMYQLLFGFPPWSIDTSEYNEGNLNIEEYLIKKRKKQLYIPDISEKFIGYDKTISDIIKKALAEDLEIRFQSAGEFIKALKGEIELNYKEESKKITHNQRSNPIYKAKKYRGRGFDAIAGMKELKEQLKLDVINAINSPEEYSKYGVTIPNGMLLYGPPGCGKTFFAKCLAEEIGFEFMALTPASLKSKYVNATQENIAKLFKEAEKKAPIIIFIDEINELLPNRENEDLHEMSKSAVNEFLAQMDRTAEKGIFIIGTTNFPNNIDPAALRSGRLEKKFYVPPPDFEARKALFKLYLKNRPLDLGIDYDKLSRLTENYVSSDIEFLVDESSRLALKLKKRISMQILEEIIKNTKPSVPLSELKKYEQINKEMNDVDNNRKSEHKLGF